VKHLIFILLATTLGAYAQNLVYETDFEEFVSGQGAWLESDNWIGNDANCVGIDDNLISGLGKTAYLGFHSPQKRKTVILRQTPIDPQTEGIDSISFRTLMGVQDSTNLKRDIFAFSIYNQAGKPLAGIRFDNRDTSYGIWRFDGANLAATGTTFLRGQVYDLRFTITYANNTWSALFDGLPLFTDQPFNTTGEAMNFLGVAGEWIVTGGAPYQHGDNWLLVADWQITTSSPLKDELTFASMTASRDEEVSFATTQQVTLVSSPSSLALTSSLSVASNAKPRKIPKLRWQARANGRYFVETVTDLGGEWNLAGESGLVLAGHRFELNLVAPDEGNRFYRIRRSSLEALPQTEQEDQEQKEP